MKNKELLKKIIISSGNVRFDDFVRLVYAFGFELDRIKGSHHIFKKRGITELINLQKVNGEIKPYQIKQFLALIEKYNIELGE